MMMRLLHAARPAPPRLRPIPPAPAPPRSPWHCPPRSLPLRNPTHHLSKRQRKRELSTEAQARRISGNTPAAGAQRARFQAQHAGAPRRRDARRLRLQLPAGAAPAQTGPDIQAARHSSPQQRTQRAAQRAHRRRPRSGSRRSAPAPCRASHSGLATAGAAVRATAAAAQHGTDGGGWAGGRQGRARCKRYNVRSLGPLAGSRPTRCAKRATVAARLPSQPPSARPAPRGLGLPRPLTPCGWNEYCVSRTECESRS